MVAKSNYFFYVLECRDTSLYAGYTNDVDRRVSVHNAGKGAKYTKARIPVTCIYFEGFETKQEAMRAEYAFKQLNRKQKLAHIRRANNEITEE